jgi:signal transduction histidine kinase
VPAHVSTGALMAALGRELIESRPDPMVAPALLDAVRTWSALRDALSNASGSDAGLLEDEREDLRARMQGSDAFDLLVEIAHDFRSPLTSILFLAETIRDGHSGEVSDLQRSQLGLVYSAAFGLAAAASDVVDLARRGRGLVDEEPEPYALPEVFRDVERLVSPIAEEKGLALRIVVPPHGRARGHPHALSRVLLNLTTNALKFTDSGAVEIGVRRMPHGRIEFYVQDTGRGIPEARQKDLFHPFKKRLGESQEGHFFSGSGVGLTIARRLVRAMGSELRFKTSDEEGTRFFFQLPANPRS